MSVGSAVVECIRREGIRHVFCVPGESYLDIMDAFYDSPDVTLVTARHEEGAGLMAEAAAKATGRPGVVLVTRGPGATHLSIALHTARQDSTPLVAFIGQVPRRVRTKEAFQEVDLVEFSRPITKWAVEINEPHRVPELLRRAFRLAQSGRPGPVVVAIPEDVCSESSDMSFRESAHAFLPGPRNGDVQRAVELLTSERSVVLIAGLGVLRSGSTDLLVRLAETLASPVYTAWRRFDAFPNDHALYLGHLPAMPAELYAPLREADVIVALGTRLGEFTSLSYTIPTLTQKLIHIDASPEVVAEATDATVGLVADCKLAIEALLTEVEAFSSTELHSRRLESATRSRRQFVGATTADPRVDTEGFVDPEGAFHDLNMILPRDTATISDAGTFAGWLTRFYRWYEPGTFFGPTAGGMGYSVPASIGVKLSRPDQPVVAFAGDGGFAMTMSEVETAVRLRLTGLLVVVFNNGAYGTIRLHQKRRFPGREIATALGDVDFAKIAIGLGAYGVRVQSNQHFADAVRDGLLADRPVILDVPLRPNLLEPWAERSR